MMNWTVYNDINNPIASINPITTTNQAGGATVTIPANPPIVPTQPWFAERLYAPTATQIDSTHLSMTFAGYGVQTPAQRSPRVPADRQRRAHREPGAAGGRAEQHQRALIRRGDRPRSAREG